MVFQKLGPGLLELRVRKLKLSCAERLINRLMPAATAELMVREKEIFERSFVTQSRKMVDERPSLLPRGAARLPCQLSSAVEAASSSSFCASGEVVAAAIVVRLSAVFLLLLARVSVIGLVRDSAELRFQFVLCEECTPCVVVEYGRSDWSRARA